MSAKQISLRKIKCLSTAQLSMTEKVNSGRILKINFIQNKQFYVQLSSIFFIYTFNSQLQLQNRETAYW